MKSFLLDFIIPRALFSIEHGDGIVLQGSCFSDEISKQLKLTGHTISKASFGTVFHPTMLAMNLLNCFEDNVYDRIFERDEIYFSWDCSSTVFASSEDKLMERLSFERNQLKQDLSKAKLLIVTFGSAWGYELIDTNEMVANCHKIPQNNFQKFLSSPYEMLQDWMLVIDKLKQINPVLQIVFTISPVRHVKDGLIENNLSKARLIEVVQQLTLEENCHYFPSYELLIDVLRDYRFYASDKIHPSEEAIAFIWEKFQETYFSDKTIEVNKKVRDLRKSLDHKSLYGETKAQINHEENVKRRLEELLQKYTTIEW